MAASEFLKTCFYLGMFICRKQTPSNKSVLRSGQEKARVTARADEAPAAKAGPSGTGHKFKRSFCRRGRGLSSPSSQLQARAGLVTSLPRQCISVPKPNYSSTGVLRNLGGLQETFQPLKVSVC